MVEKTQEQLYNHPGDTQLQVRAREIQKLAWLTCEAERKFFYQKSKCRYLLQSYQNTRLFNSIAKQNAKRNNIPVLIKDDGLKTNGMDEVVCEFLSYYYGLLGTEVKVNEVDVEILSHGPTVPLDCLEELARIPMDVEINKGLIWDW